MPAAVILRASASILGYTNLKVPAAERAAAWATLAGHAAAGRLTVDVEHLRARSRRPGLCRARSRTASWFSFHDPPTGACTGCWRLIGTNPARERGRTWNPLRERLWVGPI